MPFWKKDGRIFRAAEQSKESIDTYLRVSAETDRMLDFTYEEMS